MSVLSLSGRRRVRSVRQAEASECGLACIAMVSGYYGHDIDLITLRQRFGISLKGITLRGILDIAAELGLACRPVRCNVEELRSLRLPAIIHWGMNHFVVLDKCDRNGLIVHDPAIGKYRVSMAKASELFTGIAIEVSISSGFRIASEIKKIKLQSLIGDKFSIFKGLAHAAVLSIILEILLLCGPFYFQMVIDEGVAHQDKKILIVLALIFALVKIFSSITALLRSLSVQFVSSIIGYDLKSKVIEHLVHLPLDWFHKRSVGDIQSRFWAVKTIQGFLSQGALSALLDSVLGIVVLCLMAIYSLSLTMIVLLSLILIGVVKFASFSVSKSYASDSIINDAKEQSNLLETLRAAQTIKAAGSENIRDTLYRNAAARSINSQIKSGNVSIAFSGMQTVILGLIDILVIFFGANYVISNSLTIGMLSAFLAYKEQFVTRSLNIIEQSFSWYMLDIQMGRLSDVILSQRQPQQLNGDRHAIMSGDVSVKNISFRYAYTDKPILSNLSFDIAAGEYVALVGESGSGKSTVGKLLAGLYSPDAGDIFIDNQSLRHWNSKALRSQISYVSQDDQLLSGSIISNISGFQEEEDVHFVKVCASLACVHDEIEAMPMGYNSLVGDMGSSLSGGQKQRILIARALYRKPRILILDEATAHLDMKNERAINDNISKLNITRIIIAHRPDTIASAEKVFNIGKI